MGVGGNTPCNKANCKCLRSSFGPQAYSSKYSYPAYGFGSGARDASNKMYLSPQHSKAMVGCNSLGPMYKVYSSIGGQVESNMPNSNNHGFGRQSRLPKYGNQNMPGPGSYKYEQAVGLQHDSQRNTSPRPVFGSSQRDANQHLYINEDLNRQFYGVGTPGPNMYQTASSMGKQAQSTKESGPLWKLGTNKRFTYEYLNRARSTPGVGSYKFNESIGRQINSQKMNSTNCSFGRSTRDQITNKQFISTSHEKTQHGQCSPGPATGYGHSAFGKQEVSTKKSNPRNVFGTQRRIPYPRNDNPGPGTYCA